MKLSNFLISTPVDMIKIIKRMILNFLVSIFRLSLFDLVQKNKIEKAVKPSKNGSGFVIYEFRNYSDSFGFVDKSVSKNTKFNVS